MKTGAELIAEERQRQIEKEGWIVEHDADIYHRHCEIAWAGLCYLSDYISNMIPLSAYYHNWALDRWPWDMKFWKPTPNDPIRQLTKAGALIAAEIDRLQRKEEK